MIRCNNGQRNSVVVIDGAIDMGTTAFTAYQAWYVSVEAYAPSCNRKGSLKFSTLTIDKAGVNGFPVPTTAKKVMVEDVSVAFQDDFSADEIVMSGTSHVDLGLNGHIGKITLYGNSYGQGLYTGGALNGTLWTIDRNNRGTITIDNFSSNSGGLGSIQFEDAEVSLPVSLLNAYRGGEIQLYGSDVNYSGSLNKSITFQAYEGIFTNESCIRSKCISIGETALCKSTYCD